MSPCQAWGVGGCAVPLFPLVPLLSRGRAVLLDVRGETITLYIAHKIFLQLYSLIKELLGLESLAVTGLAERDHRQGENTPGLLAIHGCALCVWPLRYAQHVSCAVTMRRRALGALTLGQRSPLAQGTTTREAYTSGTESFSGAQPRSAPSRRVTWG